LYYGSLVKLLKGAKKLERLYTHSIQPGDDYWILAQRYNTTVNHILALNPFVNPNHLYIGQQISIPISENITRQPEHCISQAEVDYRNDMRSLWEEHVAWTRMAIISLTFNLPDIEFVLKRLLLNATDMGKLQNQYSHLIYHGKLFKVI